MAVSGQEKARRLLLAAAVGSVVGVGVAGTVSPVVGGAIVVVAWLDFVYALHSFGRAEG